VSEPAGQITDLLGEWSHDPKGSLDAVFPLVVAELRRIAASFLAAESQPNTLVATALVHELYLKLLQRERVSWQDRGHFFGFAARTMRRILVDQARRRGASKRGGALSILPLDEARVEHSEPALDVVDLDVALDELADLDPRLARVVELRYFVGLSIPEVAEILGVGTATVSRDWTTARTWLHRRLTTAPHQG